MSLRAKQNITPPRPGCVHDDCSNSGGYRARAMASVKGRPVSIGKPTGHMLQNGYSPCESGCRIVMRALRNGREAAIWHNPGD
jgi:hypothetical protein